MIRKRLPQLLLLLLAAITVVFSVSSCEKKIDVTVDEADKKLVVQAVLTDHEGGCIVSLSKTRSINDGYGVDSLTSTAGVSITDENGTITSLVKTSAGTYTHPTLKGMYGKTYLLKIDVEGKTYTATSSMPQQVVLDSIYLNKQTIFSNEQTYAKVALQDPAGVKNYYLFRAYVNGERLKGNATMDDDLSDGKKFDATLYLFPLAQSESGKTLEVEMHCIDKAVYKYWFSLDQTASTGPLSATPANPVSNITGDVLGYFSVQTVQKKTITIP